MSDWEDDLYTWAVKNLTHQQYCDFADWCARQEYPPPAFMDREVLREALVTWGEYEGNKELPQDYWEEEVLRDDYKAWY